MTLALSGFMAKEVVFSVLILSIPERSQKLKRIFMKLDAQVSQLNDPKSVELVCLLDNRVRSISDKRNALLSYAKGQFIAFLDDDDDISEDYITEITNTIKSDPDVDVVTFNQKCSINGKRLAVTFGLNNPHEGLILEKSGNFKSIKRPPYHICGWNRKIAQSEKFKPVFDSNGQSCEDIDWCIRLYPKSQKSRHINKVLHFYHYSSEESRSVFSNS